MMVSIPWWRRMQTGDYFRLGQKDLMECARLKIGGSIRYTGTRYGDDPVRLVAVRGESSINFRDKVEKTDLPVPLLATKLTYGWRWWVACPRCERRCTLLYYSVWPLYGLLCRKCVRPAYESQNGSLDAVSNMLEERRDKLIEQLWPEKDWDEYDFDNDLYPKPPDRWWRTFKRDVERLQKIERQCEELKEKKLVSLPFSIYGF